VRPLPDADTVWEALENGATLAQAERVTGWPARVIRRLIERRPGWLVDSTGRATQIRRTGHGSRPPRRTEVLGAELEARRDRHGLPWGVVASQLGLSPRTVEKARAGTASVRVRELIEAWLARPVLPLPEVEEQRELHAAVRARKVELHVSWQWVAMDAGVSLPALRTVRRGGRSTPRVRGALLAWLDRTAPAEQEAIRDAG
jgi:hypothetical protein